MVFNQRNCFLANEIELLRVLIWTLSSFVAATVAFIGHTVRTTVAWFLTNEIVFLPLKLNCCMS